MTRNAWLALATFVGTLGLGVCKMGSETEAAVVPHAADANSALPAASRTVADADNRFGFHLFHELIETDRNKNVVVSPLSAATALLMTANGARGETREAMAKTLQIDGLAGGLVNDGNAGLRTSLEKPDPKVELEIANSLWFHLRDPVLPAFRQMAERQFGAEIGDLAGAPDNINAWVSKRTKGRIPSIVTPPDVAAAAAVLVNAVYFKGKWTAPFEKAQTKPEPFHLVDGKSVSVPMMHQSGTYSYLKTNGFEAARLPYGNGRLFMTVMLPDAGTDFQAFLEGLTADKWKRWAHGFHKLKGAVGVPRLTTRYSADLNDPLAALGMGIAFTSHADFKGMMKGPLWISKVRQKTFLELNEEGTEAAAATAVVMTRGMVRPEPHFSLVLNRPFVCAVEDSESGAILFLGAIVEP